MAWHKLLSRNDVDITTISQIDRVFYDLIKKYGRASQKEPFFTLLEGKSMTHYIAVDPHTLGQALYRKLFHSPAQVQDYFFKGKILLRQIARDTKHWKRIVDRAPTRQHIARAFFCFCESFARVNTTYSITSWIALEAWQKDFDELFSNLIQKRGLDSRRDTLAARLCSPWKKTAIIKLQEKLARGVRPEKLLCEYQFLRNWTAVWYRPLSLDWLRQLRVHTPEKKRTRALSLNHVRGLLKPNAAQKKMLEFAPYAIFFKDWRDDVRRFQVYRWSFLFDAIATHLGIFRADLGYYTLEEIVAAVRHDTLAPDVPDKRKRGCVIIPGPGRALLIHDMPTSVEKYRALARQADRENGADVVIRGTIAQKGIVRGCARIIRIYHDLKRVKDGDVIIANTTHPDYLPAMQKAAAFVTNEGGIVSHAAIVAREMKKPCIVGTRNATRMINDGDYIEVDADRGIVSIVSR